MKRSEQDRLLREILNDERVERLRDASLIGGLTAVRSRRHLRTVVATGVASIAIAASLVLVLHRRQAPALTHLSPPAPVSHIKVINDDELLALFPNRSVALIGAPGQQQLVFLDGPSPPAGSPAQNE